MNGNKERNINKFKKKVKERRAYDATFVWLVEGCKRKYER